ncbi:Hypothetical predicted protein [Mytilus galloprovincialis]|uniref:Uncharacterized protein n=1 Tax=Mytilus galloprovincialis TaxID=29158 RepID=A0A8B6CIX3_MYTGA|nr:Hypothetical predicted protein [Mytilus galloprovincialis]
MFEVAANIIDIFVLTPFDALLCLRFLLPDNSLSASFSNLETHVCIPMMGWFSLPTFVSSPVL